jgi:hypothetical protein
VVVMSLPRPSAIPACAFDDTVFWLPMAKEYVPAAVVSAPPAHE